MDFVSKGRVESPQQASLPAHRRRANVDRHMILMDNSKTTRGCCLGPFSTLFARGRCDRAPRWNAGGTLPTGKNLFCLDVLDFGVEMAVWRSDLFSGPTWTSRNHLAPDCKECPVSARCRHMNFFVYDECDEDGGYVPASRTFSSDANRKGDRRVFQSQALACVHSIA
jgi:hypothetical protein